MTNNQPTRTVKASSRTHFFDVKTTQNGCKCLTITESRIKEKYRSQITISPEDALSLLAAIEQAVASLVAHRDITKE